jgi:predicted TIM-barrel fold metal-dependent hydrolase
MTDREAWLKLTREVAVEPELPICDPHHHLWNHPGSRYLVDEFLQDLGGGHRIASTVFVECLQFYRPEGPAELRPVGETEFIDSIAGKYPTPNGSVEIAAGIVAFADLTLGAKVQTVLDAHQATSKRLRGIRHATAWDVSEQVHNAHTRPTQDVMQQPDFLAGLTCLQRSGLVFDAWVFHPQVAQLAQLAKEFPQLTIVLNHMAGPIGVGPYAANRERVMDDWKAALALLAGLDNVYVKLGGRTMTMAGFAWHKRDKPAGSVELAEQVGPYYQYCIDLLGAERCMFESNFPVDRASCSYTVLWNAYKRLSQHYPATERAALLHDTATRVYRLAAS